MLSKKVFIASDAILAFIDRAHPKHIHAEAMFRYFAQERYFLYTSILVMQEAYRKIADTMSVSIARDFLKAMSLGNINILYPEEADMKLTLKTIANHPSNDLSFAEAFTAVIANRRNIGQICTFSYLRQLFGLQVFYLPI